MPSGGVKRSDDVSARKWTIREQVWERLTNERQAAFPFPIRLRIPNFRGAAEAAARFAELPEFQRARVVKVNPDAPQRLVRRLVLEHGKMLLMPTPRLRGGFVRVDPGRLPKSSLAKAASISGAFDLGETVALDDLPHIDLLVFGSVAVTTKGGRLGKGEGFAELEYATLRQLDLIDESIPIATTVHDSQLVDDVPREDFDVPVDIIATPTRVIRTNAALPKPSGILWDCLAPERLEEMPILRELKDKSRR